jgi:hypothetical protein
MIFSRIKDPVMKQTNKLNRNFSKEELQMATKHIELLTTPGHKGNTNQNHIKLPPPSC